MECFAMNSCPTCGLAYPVDFTLCPRDGAKLVEVGVWSEGSIVRGKYRILSKVGQGGMGSVYKALHLRFGEIRALKVIGQELAIDATFVKRFEHEAVITRKLQHPNAVRVDDIDEAEDGRPFIVMEFIDGASLKKLIQNESPLPVSRVCSVIKQAASALDAAHRLGMVHRDIKPDNIVLVETPEGEQAKILDFGIAKVKEARLCGETSGLTLTGTGIVVGTPQYMSPEQAAGKRGDEIDGRSDIYSLGIVMYQMLTHELPFKADTTMAMLLAHMQIAPTPIQKLCPDLRIPEAIASVVMRCLAKDRNLRPASAKALIEELELAESALDQSACGPTRTPASKEPSQTGYAASRAQPPQPLLARSARWGVWVSTAIALVVLAIGGWYFERGSSGTATAHPPTDQSGGVPASKTVTAAQPQPEENTGESRIGITLPQSVQSGQQEGSRLTAPAPNRSSSTPVTTAASSPMPARRNSIEIEKQIKGAASEGDFHYENGEYDEAIKSYQQGLRLDSANVTLRQRIQRAKKGKAVEAAVKQ
jgi:serine/threonine protein kinase